MVGGGKQPVKGCRGRVLIGWNLQDVNDGGEVIAEFSLKTDYCLRQRRQLSTCLTTTFNWIYIPTTFHKQACQFYVFRFMIPTNAFADIITVTVITCFERDHCIKSW